MNELTALGHVHDPGMIRYSTDTFIPRLSDVQGIERGSMTRQIIGYFRGYSEARTLAFAGHVD